MSKTQEQEKQTGLEDKLMDVVQLFRPNAKNITQDDRDCVRLIQLVKHELMHTRGPSEKVYNWKEAAIVMYADYYEKNKKGREGMEEDIRRYALRLTDMSSHGRGVLSLALIPFNDRTADLYAKKKGNVTVAEVVATYHKRPFLPYTHIAAFGHMNGVYIAGFEAQLLVRFHRGVVINNERLDGFKQQGTASVDSVQAALEIAERASTPRLRLES